MVRSSRLRPSGCSSALRLRTTFAIGTRASGRTIGEYPGLERLDDDGNLRATADFRGL